MLEDIEKIGKVLWWSKKDKKGIILDPKGNEFYFDDSVLNIRPRQKIEPESIVIFAQNIEVSEVLCAKNIKLPLARFRDKFEKLYIQEAIQLSLFDL